MTYHNYIFFTVDKSIHDLPKTKLAEYRKAFVAKIENTKDIIVYSYTLLGLKKENIFLLWIQSDSLEITQNFLNNLLHTEIGKYLHCSETLFGMTRPTQYSPGSTTHENTARKGGKYLIIYPFTKTQEWYMLDFQKRKELMKGHITIGRKYPQITQLLLYSYGIDDNEFIVSYETDSLADFQQLIIELRTDPVRNYTKKDTPIFTCIYRTLEETVHFI
ncbi:MAG TPA: chlorite dismutase family protein [Candidatus Saccharimonadales bacterium]|nr:chlorite dismutase family protein [Candidatus Saccharimonadales bacterium]